jgi:hypothetical protein
MFNFHAHAIKEIIRLKILLWKGLIYKWDLPPYSTREERVLIIGPKKSASDKNIVTKKS